MDADLLTFHICLCILYVSECVNMEVVLRAPTSNFLTGFQKLFVRNKCQDSWNNPKLHNCMMLLLFRFHGKNPLSKLMIKPYRHWRATAQY